MRILLSILVFLNAWLVGRTEKDIPELSEIRSLYQESPDSKVVADRFIKLLDGMDEHAGPLLVCYKGVAEMMQAKHIINPVKKLTSFNKGKELMEQAVRKAPDQLEIRYLRFTIQTNLPAFLNYCDDIAQDKRFLLSNVEQTADEELKQYIVTFLLKSKYCSEEEKKKLK